MGLDDGSCLPAGIPAELCAEGFDSDGEQGCVPVLPASPCGPGEMAVPGDESCREVMPCGDGTWGDIAVESNTEYVDSSYAGGDSDGSGDKPWTTIQEGVDGAEAGAIVAVAAGSYTEDVVIQSKPVRLWGRCPSMVEVVGTGVEYSAVEVRSGAPASEVVGLAITGPSSGLGLLGSLGLVVDSVWIHDTEDLGLDVERYYGPTSGVLRNSLIEGCQFVGVYLYGADLTVEDSVIRSTIQPTSGPYAGNYGMGFYVADDESKGAPATLLMTGSLVEQTTMIGIYSIGGSISLDGTVVRDTQPTPMGTEGIGIVGEVNDLTGVASHVALNGCFLAGNRGHGVLLHGGSLTASATVVRDTLHDQDGIGGRGFTIQAIPQGPVSATAHISQSLVDGNGNTGIFGAGVELTVESTVVRRTVPDIDQWYGRGINIRPYPMLGYRPVLWLTGSLISENHDVGIFVGGGDAIIDRSLIQDTLTRPDGGFGDGITVISDTDDFGAAHVVDSRVARSARVGLANFGSVVTLERAHLDCSPIALNGEQDYPFGPANVSLPFTFNDWGGNVCGCGADTVECQVLSSGLLPPDP
jgi:hypothetical protein